MLIVEDGTIVSSANSYQSLADARIDAANRGLTLNADDPIAETELIRAFYFLTSNYERLMQGRRVSAEQTGFMPRNYLSAHGFAIDSDTIPSDFKRAQVDIASVISSGVDLNTVKSTQDLASFSVDGVYSESYKTDSKAVLVARISSVDQLLFPYTKAGLADQSGSGGIYRESMGYL